MEAAGVGPDYSPISTRGVGPFCAPITTRLCRRSGGRSEIGLAKHGVRVHADAERCAAEDEDAVVEDIGNKEPVVVQIVVDLRWHMHPCLCCRGTSTGKVCLAQHGIRVYAIAESTARENENAVVPTVRN